MRAGLAGVLCCMLLLGACRAPLEDGDDLQAARTAIAERQWSRAERLLGRYLRDERNPDLRWQAWNALLTVLEAGGDPRTNLDYLDAMLEEFADDDARSREILLRIGRLNERLRRYDRAADTWIAYLNVAGLPPEESLYGYRRLGAMLFHLRRFEAAEEALQQCLALPLPDEAKSMCTYDLADQYLARGSWNEAADLARQIVDDEPQGELRALAGFVLGDALEQLGRNDEALKQFEAIRDLYPNPGVIDNRIVYLKKTGKSDAFSLRLLLREPRGRFCGDSRPAGNETGKTGARPQRLRQGRFFRQCRHAQMVFYGRQGRASCP